MARARNIKPGFFTNEELVELPFATRLLFIGLWTIADRAGRMEDRPKKIKMALFPADDMNVDAALGELQASGFLLRYEADGQRYIQVLAFNKHQNPHKDEKASLIPPPCEHGASMVQEPNEHGGNPADSLFSDSPIPDSLIADTGRERPEAPTAPAAPKKPRKPAKIPLPIDFSISEAVKAWAASKGHGNLQAHFDSFVGKVRANGYCYVDWDQALQNAIRDDWAKLGQRPQAGVGPPRQSRHSGFENIDYHEGIHDGRI